jgi:hypothetical protein
MVEMRTAVFAIVSSLIALGGSAAFAGEHKAKHWKEPRVARDCTPINGFYGYYGNPWCDTGSYRPPDIQFREREKYYRRHYRIAR